MFSTYNNVSTHVSIHPDQLEYWCRMGRKVQKVLLLRSVVVDLIRKAMVIAADRSSEFTPVLPVDAKLAAYTHHQNSQMYTCKDIFIMCYNETRRDEMHSFRFKLIAKIERYMCACNRTYCTSFVSMTIGGFFLLNLIRFNLIIN